VRGHDNCTKPIPANEHELWVDGLRVLVIVRVFRTRSEFGPSPTTHIAGAK
jgi:hypothetical protein